MTLRWELLVGNDSVTAVYYDVPEWASLLITASDLFDEFDARVTDHRLCGSGLSEFWWRLPVGRAKHDEEWSDDHGPLVVNSVGAMVWELSNKKAGAISRLLDKYEVSREPMTLEAARERFPEKFFSSFLDEDEEEA